MEENILLYRLNKDAESILSSTKVPMLEKLPLKGRISEEDAQKYRSTLIKEIEMLTGTSDVTELNLYEVDKAKIDIEYSDEYILDIDTMQLYNVNGAKYYGRWHHTLKGNGQKEEMDSIYVEDEPSLEIQGDIGWYKPDMNGFSFDTYLEYYNMEDQTDIKEISVKEYIANGKQSKIVEDEKTYALDDYENLIWANAKTNAYELECWWVWIPRYAYQPDTTNRVMNVIFIDIDNKPIGTKYNALPEGYIPHPAFTVQNDDGTYRQLQGIWMSKYETTNNKEIRPIYSGECYAPDMEGFDPNNTYIEYFDIETNTFDEEILLKDANLKTVNNEKRWYDYQNRIWANIKTNANELEAWWTWIPRYAYSKLAMSGSTELEIIFIDTNNKPIDTAKYGKELPEYYIVHPAFTIKNDDGTYKELKGIWMSKYETTNNKEIRPIYSGECYAPDMEGFDPNNTYIEYFDLETNTFDEEILLKDANLNTVNSEKRWYDYQNRIWANIKTYANELECWWTWIPRYAYSNLAMSGSTELEIIFVDTNNKPIDTAKYGQELPEYYILHPAFTIKNDDGTYKELKGIWMSKYETTNKN